MLNDAENRVSKFYNTVGWETEEEITEDARRWEDLREYAKDYVSKCRLRVLRHIPDSGFNMLDMASGPIQYNEYLEYSRNFMKRYCIDLSASALEKARTRIGDHGVFLQGSFFDIPLESDFFDCSVSLHTIYHIDKDRQEEAVRKLIHVTKPGKPVIVVYSNPITLVALIGSLFPFRLLKNCQDHNSNKDESTSLYFHAHSVEWWSRFSDIADVNILPWRSFAANIQKRLIPNNKLGKTMLDMLFTLEERFPKFFVKYFQYSMIILKKR